MRLKFDDKEINQFLKDLGAFAQSQNTEINIVGGYVRDSLLGIISKDLDFIVESNAIEFAENYKKHLESQLKQKFGIEIVESFKPFGTVKIQASNLNCEIEFGSTRKEIYKEPAAFPTVTGFTTIKEDLTRRDFTINALLASIMPDNFGEIIDHVSGLDDLNNKLIRVFHDQSFIDDPTRIYRAIRFMAKFDFQIEAHTLELMEAAAKHPDFPKWFKKRKSRFEIELNYINKLPTTTQNSLLETWLPFLRHLPSQTF